MKAKQNLIQRGWLLLLSSVVLIFTLQSCGKDEVVYEDPIATFQFELSPDNWRKVIFTNFSLNATSFAWEFGDTRTSTEKDPVHTFDGA